MRIDVAIRGLTQRPPTGILISPAPLRYDWSLVLCVLRLAGRLSSQVSRLLHREIEEEKKKIKQTRHTLIHVSIKLIVKKNPIYKNLQI